MAHAGKARLLREKGMARTQVWRISMGKDGAPFFISTPTHAAPHEPLFEQLQEDMDTPFGPDPPAFLLRLLALKDGMAEIYEGKCTHTLLHAFL